MQAATLQLDYVPHSALNAQSSSWWGDVLGVVGFDRAPRIDRAQVPVTASMTPALGAGDDLCEVWRVPGASNIAASASASSRGRVHHRYCDELLFGSISLDEPDLADGAAGLLHATVTAYQEIFAVLRETRHAHLVRVWNHLPEINRECDGDERYRHFNSARRSAFRDSGRDMVVGARRQRIGLAGGESYFDLFPGLAPSAADDRESAADQRLPLSTPIR